MQKIHHPNEHTPTQLKIHGGVTNKNGGKTKRKKPEQLLMNFSQNAGRRGMKALLKLTNSEKTVKREREKREGTCVPHTTNGCVFTYGPWYLNTNLMVI